MPENRKLRRLELETKRKYLSGLKNAQSQAEKDRLHDEYFHVVHEEIETRRRFLEQERLLEKAQRLLVDKPSANDWETGWDGTKLIKLNALSKLKSDIRIEHKAKRDVWLPWLSMITGLIAALTGLFAVWFSN